MASQHRDDAPEQDRSQRRSEGDGRREHREGRLRDFARRILAERPPREGEEIPEREAYVPLEVARDALGSLLETGDRAKTEMVRMVAREVRHYLDELHLVEGMEHMLRNYSLEVHASLSLEPKGERKEGEEAVKVEAKPVRKRGRQPKAADRAEPVEPKPEGEASEHDEG
jgi:hypothetical protein